MLLSLLFTFAYNKRLSNPLTLLILTSPGKWTVYWLVMQNNNDKRGAQHKFTSHGLQ